MKISELLTKEGISVGNSFADKESVIDCMIGLHEQLGNLNDREEFGKAVIAREAKAVTAFGTGIAVPHAKSASVKRAGLTAVTVPQGVDYGAQDGEPCRLFFMIAVPDASTDTHVDVLAGLMRMLVDSSFTKALAAAGSPDEFMDLIRTKEERME
ncbi:MAG: PTS sugar transporter subunit IIA [Lachnospiraceae bacterium]|nr:PTS sugar transporter subunit IIA [Lachnospiraceae bacterium]